jgi:hypothetical protein
VADTNTARKLKLAIGIGYKYIYKYRHALVLGASFVTSPKGPMKDRAVPAWYGGTKMIDLSSISHEKSTLM